MATPSEKLAKSLEALKVLQDSGIIAIRSVNLGRTDRERLLKYGFIREVIKGWYIATSPNDREGDSTPWYTAFWDFSSQYLDERFGAKWSISPEQSLSLHAGNSSVPDQLLIRAVKGSNNMIALMYGTSIMDIAADPASATDQVMINSVRAYSLSAALANCGPSYFRQNPIDARGALLSVADASTVLRPLLDGGKSLVAGRLAGAFRNIGRPDVADEILDTFRSLDYKVREEDPFEASSPVLSGGLPVSPYVSRIQLMWKEMRVDVIATIPSVANPLTGDTDSYLDRVSDIFVTDAYHSLSIEGYTVSLELINKVRNGEWDPDNNNNDKEHRNAMAARGYWEAFNIVKETITRILSGENSGKAAKADHGRWYRSLFAPSVASGILSPGDLAGYRNIPVYIRGSMHTPLSPDAVRDAMPAFFKLLEDEPSSEVRAVLGHFLFVYIHPYMDGNGRTARFLMNAMMASGGYEWAVIPVERRDEYMAALEQASVRMDIKPFAQFISEFTLTHTPK